MAAARLLGFSKLSGLYIMRSVLVRLYHHFSAAHSGFVMLVIDEANRLFLRMLAGLLRGGRIARAALRR